MRTELEKARWRVTAIYGVEYEVEIEEFSDYKGGCFSGIYWYNGVKIGYGCFSICDILKLERVENE